MARSWQVCRVLFCVLLVASINASASDLTLMTFNVENLFDSRHDEGKNDETYLPKALKADPRIRKQATSRSLHNGRGNATSHHLLETKC